MIVFGLEVGIQVSTAQIAKLRVLVIQAVYKFEAFTRLLGRVEALERHKPLLSAIMSHVVCPES